MLYKLHNDPMERSPGVLVALMVPQPIAAEIERHMRAALPAEGCGLLAVPTMAEPVAEVVRFYPGTNILGSPTRFTMHPAEVQAAFQDMDRHGWQLGAIVHSHPTSRPTPSPIDLREAFYPDALILIVSLANGVPEMGAWQLQRDGEQLRPIAVPIHVIEKGKRVGRAS